jgi:hypothetical protein
MTNRIEWCVYCRTCTHFTKRYLLTKNLMRLATLHDFADEQAELYCIVHKLTRLDVSMGVANGSS